MTLHHTSGPAADIFAAGFNLADVSSVAQLNALPDKMFGVVWIDPNVGATDAFKAKIRTFANNPKLFGFRLGDEPDITGKYKTRTDPAAYKAETDFIKQTCPGAKTFVTLMDMGPYSASDFMNTYTKENTGIDLFGIDPYPVRSVDGGRTTVYDINYIDRSVAAALKSGIKLEQIVPVFQAFGGGAWTIYTDSKPGGYKLPTPDQAKEMLARWAKLVPDPVFDFAWIWEVKNGHTSIGSTTAEALALREVFKAHNTYVAPVEPPVPEPSKYAAIAKTLHTLAEQFEAL